MIPPHLRFADLRRALTIEHVLVATDRAGALRRRGRRLVGPCPLHGGDNPTAFVVDLDQDLWYCFTRCAGGGDVVELARRLGGGGYGEAARLLAHLAALPVGPAPSSGPAAAPSAPPPAPFRPFRRRLPLDPAAGFLERKGIRPETARRFESGMYQGAGFCAGCVAVRLHDPQGRPLGYAARRLDPEQARRHGKWKLPPRLPKRRILYGYHRVDDLAAGLVVVEGPWDVMRLAQLAVPAVAILGTRLSDTQRRLLARAPELVLLLDGDRPGREATARLRRELSQVTRVRVALLPDGLDPDDLVDEHLLDYLRRA